MTARSTIIFIVIYGSSLKGFSDISLCCEIDRMLPLPIKSTRIIDMIGDQRHKSTSHRLAPEAAL